MSFELNEEQNIRRNIPHQGTTSGMTGFLIKIGVAKDERVANYILIGCIGALLLIMFFSLSSLGGSSSIEDSYDPLLDDPSLNI